MFWTSQLCQNELSIGQGSQQLKHLQTDRQTDTQTGATERIHTPHSRMVHIPCLPSRGRCDQVDCTCRASTNSIHATRRYFIRGVGTWLPHSGASLWMKSHIDERCSCSACRESTLFLVLFKPLIFLRVSGWECILVDVHVCLRPLVYVISASVLDVDVA